MQATKIPLNPQTVTRLKAWLTSQESVDFRNLIADLALADEMDALKELRQSEGDDGHRVEALDLMESAKMYQFMLHVIDSAALGHTFGKPTEIFPYITLVLNKENPAATIVAEKPE